MCQRRAIDLPPFDSENERAAWKALYAEPTDT